MYLSNRLTFSIFSVLLVAALLVAPSVMAQVTVKAYVTTDTGESKKNSLTLNFVYSEAPDPVPTKAHFTLPDGPDDDDVPDPLPDATPTSEIDKDGMTIVKLTFTLTAG